MRNKCHIGENIPLDKKGINILILNNTKKYFIFILDTQETISAKNVIILCKEFFIYYPCIYLSCCNGIYLSCGYPVYTILHASMHALC